MEYPKTPNDVTMRFQPGGGSLFAGFWSTFFALPFLILLRPEGRPHNWLMCLPFVASALIVIGIQLVPVYLDFSRENRTYIFRRRLIPSMVTNQGTYEDLLGLYPMTRPGRETIYIVYLVWKGGKRWRLVFGANYEEVQKEAERISKTLDIRILTEQEFKDSFKDVNFSFTIR